MRKGIKIFLILMIFMGMMFSIFNFIAVEIKAINGGEGIPGSWVFHNGSWECMACGDECNIEIEMP